MEKMHFTMHLVAMRKCCILRGALILGPWMFNTFQIIHDLFLNIPAHTTFLNQSSQKLQIHVIASSGNRTQAACMAGKHSTTEPTMLDEFKSLKEIIILSVNSQSSK